MDINEHLAVKVMGWKPMVYPHGKVWAEDTDLGECYLMERGEWNPRESIEQAIMCLYSFGKLFVCNGFNISGEPGYENFSCWIEDGEEGVQADGHKTLEEAISTAVARATGWEE